MTGQTDKNIDEFYILVDVETAGPNPSQYAMLSIGACTLSDPVCATFYVELQPDSMKFQEEALDISGLSLEHLAEKGTPPLEAMQAFADWVGRITPESAKPVFTALNAPFDWMFVNDYFHRYLGQNPFGHSALDIKAFFMGLRGVNWKETSYKHISRYYKGHPQLSHNALQDVLDTAEFFKVMLLEAKEKHNGTG